MDWLREALRQYRAQLVVPDRPAAIRLALTSSELARQAIGMASTPVLLEFTCGACDALDDFTSYLTPDKLEDLYAMIDGNFVGLGDRAEDRQGRAAPGRRDPRRPGLGGGPQGRRARSSRSAADRSREWASTRPPTGSKGPREPPIELDVRRRDGYDPGIIAWSAATSRSRASRKARIVDRGRWHRLSPALGLPEDLGR